MRACSAFFFNDTATTEIYPLSLHDALPISENEAKRHKEYARERLRGRSGPADDLYCEWSGGGLRTQVDKDAAVERLVELGEVLDRKSTRLNSSHANISYAVVCVQK